MGSCFPTGLAAAFSHFRAPLRFLPAISVALTLVVHTALWFLCRSYYPLISVENGPMEIFQAVALLGGCAILAWRASRVESTHDRLLLLGLAIFYLTFVFGEIDTRVLASPFLELVFDGAVRNLLLGLLWGGAFVAFFRHRHLTWRRFREWLPSAGGILLLTAGGFWLVSGGIDKLHLLPGTHHFFEELAEVNAVMLMLLTALHAAFLWFPAHPPFQEPF
jgi:hypothetical protein